MYCFYLAENGSNYLCMSFDFPGNLKHKEKIECSNHIGLKDSNLVKTESYCPVFPRY